MKRVKSRATAALIIAAMIVCGMGVYVFRFVSDGADWASFGANRNVYDNGMLAACTLTDRNGVVLAHASDGKRSYAESASVRTACLHAVGDWAGNIGTGALTAFSKQLSGYSIASGVSENGGTAALTIDSRLNETAYAALAGRRGAVLVMDYTTGEILCMVSSPAYDPDAGFDSSDSYYEGAYLNRCLSASYTPGSVFKLITLAAAIENMDDIYSRSFYCSGSRDINGINVKCTGVHGSQTIEQALANSCNCAFAEISLELGADTLYKYAQALGFCSQQEVSGIYTAAGSFQKAPAGSADLAWSGIGQYTDLVCPYAMLRYVSAIASGGSVREGTLLKGARSGSTRLLSAETAGSIAEMMSYNVAYSYGSGNFPGLKLCAKSGTAETGDGSSHAWFTGFLDDSEHPYAFCVVIENGGGGLRNAGAVANTVLQYAVSAEYDN